MLKRPIRANSPKERECRLVVELIGPIKGSLQMSLDVWPFCGEFTIIGSLTSSTNNYFLRTCSEPRIIEISLAGYTKPSSYRGKE